ncbi:MAG: ribonuclease HII [Mycoplasmataceae bacterium]|nr:ribonuclease HII [Mycoplasmataceae bacterium]
MKKKYNMYAFENKYRIRGYKSIVGIDEAGRGSWAGPLVVAAVALPLNYHNNEINDSKQLSINQREKLFEEIRQVAVDYAVVFIDPVQVDELNPKQASIDGMKKALEELKIKKPSVVLIDAEKIEMKTANQSIIKGDEKSISIAAASILAKVSRDRYMIKMNKIYPQYHFAKHKGYGTVEHLMMLRKYGPIKNFHRFSYKPIQKILKIFRKTKTL